MPETFHRVSTPQPVDHLGVVGGGTMGAGIAACALEAGLSVTLLERDSTALDAGLRRVRAIYQAQVDKGRLTADAMAATLARLTGVTRFDTLSRADVVIEAVFEHMDAKKQVFVELDRVCRAGAVLATNTSYLDIEEIASVTSRPQDVLGLHFFSPAHVMKLLEIVVPHGTSDSTVATAFGLADRLGKIAVRAGVCDGFIGNRIASAYRTATDHLLEDGASPYDIDEALRTFGYPIGPFQVADLVGGDIGWATRQRRAPTRDPAARYVHIADRLCERGWFGQKTGRGYYRYADGQRTGTRDPEVLAIVDEERAKAGVVPRAFSADDIVSRCLAATINEAANVLHEGIAQRPSDIDLTFVHGYGFPRHRGGPLQHADQVGLAHVLADIRRFHTADPLFWRPSPLLVALVDRGSTFDTLNHAPTPT